MTSTCPMTISSGSSIPFTACSASTLVPNCPAMRARVSPCWTTYVSCGGCGAGVCGGAVGAGDATGVGVATVALGVTPGGAEPDGDARSVGDALGTGVAVPLADGDQLSFTWAKGDPGAASNRPSRTAPATATAPTVTAAAAIAPATIGPRGARRARPAMPRQTGSGAMTIRVDTSPSPRMTPGPERPVRAWWAT